jgi:hypothetical protein
MKRGALPPAVERDRRRRPPLEEPD